MCGKELAETDTLFVAVTCENKQKSGYSPQKCFWNQKSILFWLPAQAAMFPKNLSFKAVNEPITNLTKEQLWIFWEVNRLPKWRKEILLSQWDTHLEKFSVLISSAQISWVWRMLRNFNWGITLVKCRVKVPKAIINQFCWRM